jgi:hypothetical protein
MAPSRHPEACGFIPAISTLAFAPAMGRRKLCLSGRRPANCGLTPEFRGVIVCSEFKGGRFEIHDLELPVRHKPCCGAADDP